MIIGVTGFMRSGKDSIANVLVEDFGFIRHGFADTLKEMAYAIDPIVEVEYGWPPLEIHLSSIVDSEGWEAAKEYPEARRFLQRLGTEGVRNHLGDNIWAQTLLKKLSDPVANYVIPDTRFLNESLTIKVAGGDVWRVVRPGCEASGHASETEMVKIVPDVIIDNSGTLEDLRERVAEALVLTPAPDWIPKEEM